MCYKCPCCGYYTLDHVANGSYDICPVCFWEDDIVQNEEPEFEGGANIPCLMQAQKNFQKYGASELRLVQYVRKPLQEELHGID